MRSPRPLLEILVFLFRVRELYHSLAQPLTGEVEVRLNLYLILPSFTFVVHRRGHTVTQKLYEDHISFIY